MTSMATADTTTAILTDHGHIRPQNARWLGRRELLAMVIGTVIYIILTWFTGFARLNTGFGLELRPSIVIPIIMGFVYGPAAGFVVGALGTTISDNWFYNDIWWQWSVGNGIMGFVPGLYALHRRSYHSLRDQVIAFSVAVAGILAGMGFAAFSSILICQEGTAPAQCYVVPITFDMALDTFMSAVRVNIISVVILLPVLLFNIARIDLHQVNWMTSGLLRRLLLAIIVSAALPIALLGFFLVQHFESATVETTSVIVRLMGTVTATLLFTVANASLVAQTLNRPLLRLTEAAELMQTGQLTEEQVKELQQTQGTDEISQLSRVFGNMAQGVIQRETHLRRQVEELKIRIDENKKQEAVEEIAETEFFRSLQEKSRDLRRRRQNAE